MPDDLKTLVSHFNKIVDDFVVVNNEYVKTKINEEKAKVSILTSFFLSNLSSF